MKVYALMGGFDNEGEFLLGVFASKEDLLKFIVSERYVDSEILAYDNLGYVEAELGQFIDINSKLKRL